jgi:hypothetical protein
MEHHVSGSSSRLKLMLWGWGPRGVGNHVRTDGAQEGCQRFAHRLGEPRRFLSYALRCLPIGSIIELLGALQFGSPNTDRGGLGVESIALAEGRVELVVKLVQLAG